MGFCSLALPKVVRVITGLFAVIRGDTIAVAYDSRSGDGYYSCARHPKSPSGAEARSVDVFILLRSDLIMKGVSGESKESPAFCQTPTASGNVPIGYIRLRVRKSMGSETDCNKPPATRSDGQMSHLIEDTKAQEI